MTYVLKPDLLQKKFYEVFINTLPFFFPVKADSFGSIFCWNCNGQIYQRKIILAETAPGILLPVPYSNLQYPRVLPGSE